MNVYTVVVIIQACIHVYVCIHQLCKLVFTIRECYHCISDHGKIMAQSVMLSRPLPIYRRRSDWVVKKVFTTPNRPEDS